MNHLASTLSLPLSWLSRFGFVRESVIDAAQKQSDTQRLHLAFQRAYRTFAQTHLHWINRRFDADLLRPAVVELCGDDRSQINTSPIQRVAIQLALRWDAQFGCLYTTEMRIRQIEELKVVAAKFLRLFQQERPLYSTTQFTFRFSGNVMTHWLPCKMLHMTHNRRSL